MRGAPAAPRSATATLLGGPEPQARLAVSSELAAEREPRFRLYSAEELLELPAPVWLLDRHITENSLAVVYGAPGAGKSFLTLAWSLAIASHTPWLAFTARWGPVVYVAAEGGAGLGQRTQAYRDAHELSSGSQIRFIREPVNLLQDADVSDLMLDVALGLVHLRPALFVFDTVARCMAGGDENSAQDMGRVIAATDRLRRETDAAVLLVHHTGKSGDSERGSSALRGAADSMFALKNEEGTLTLECTKQKDALAIEAQRFRLVPVGGSCAIEPLEGSSAPKGMTPNCGKALRALMDNFVGGDSGVIAWLKVSGVPEGSFYRTIKALQEFGYVAKHASRYVVTAAGESALKVTITAPS